MDTEQGGKTASLASSDARPRAGGGRSCDKCGSLLEEGAAFCSNCGTEAPPATLTFDALPEWWKKAAIGLVGLTVVGVLVSSLWPSGDSAVPEPASAAAEPETSASNDPSPPRSRPPMARPPVRKSTSRKTVSSPMGDWNVRTELSPLDDIKTVYLDLKAADSREVRGTSAYAPQMGLMCTGSKIEGYVFIRSRPEVDRSGLATVRIRFDTLEPQTRRLEKSLKEDALFLDKPASTLKDMLGHERMLFGYTPLGSEEVVTEFNLRGVEEAVKPFVEGCDIPELAEDEQAPEEVQTETP